jgi:hypothetical protein
MRPTTMHAVQVFIGRAPRTLCGIYVNNDRVVADRAFATCKKCQRPKSTHMPTYHRRRLGTGPQGGGAFYGYKIDCSCGWSMKVNENKKEARKWFNDHVREVRQKSRP